MTPTPLDVRRARATGILADPQHALDLMSGRDANPSHGARSGATNLYVHLTPADLARETGGATIEKLGAATTELLTAWLARFAATGARITIRPVLDLSDLTAVDQHDPSEPMREAVLLRDAHCVFPSCGRDSRSCDLDHITEYLSLDDDGPPGQTHPGNLAPLCRTHHRVKTHSPWVYKRLDDASYVWTSPTGHQYTVLLHRPASLTSAARTTATTLSAHTPATTTTAGGRGAPGPAQSVWHRGAEGVSRFPASDRRSAQQVWDVSGPRGCSAR